MCLSSMKGGHSEIASDSSREVLLARIANLEASKAVLEAKVKELQEDFKCERSIAEECERELARVKRERKVRE